ncbi:ATPase AAA [Desulfosarcina ovata subsp. sediminis]|uniref:Replication-associated recombination protein A n=1 Tax=Desulfosarcina ovata subsp. sediminis TaxID=885957 RepID=A0A5K7ZZQ5_9BACT|nr:replication-associated recombination protein A [Desulfosarcina ovata]BBO85678.1 ATPase AAA [Desulfosarcina ovata subsp. sediminis]
MDLFDQQAESATDHERPLAERMRPRRLGDVFGQNDVTGPGSLVRHAIENDRIFSMILWGPPGCGKTTLARIVARETRSHFIHFSAVLSGVKQIRETIEDAKKQRRFQRRRTILFVDEIHRFNKAQQDAFLHHVESGLITLIGATTENPSFEVISALLSRCRVITLNLLDEAALGQVIDRALADEAAGLGGLGLSLSEEARQHLVSISSGDARSALNNLEVAATLALAEANAEEPAGRTITLAHVEKALQKKALLYDKHGDEHFNLISAFHKSLRGSDPDAALYWLARMLEAGEDALYVARRMVRFASEDIGNADPFALRIALGAMASFRFLGHPEGDLALAQAAVYLATAPKSNSVYKAWNAARKVAREKGALPVPLHIRNAPTGLMKDLGYGKEYRYAHDFKDGYAVQEYLPDAIAGNLFYFPTDRGYEKMIAGRVKQWRALKEKNKK